MKLLILALLALACDKAEPIPADDSAQVPGHDSQTEADADADADADTDSDADADADSDTDTDADTDVTPEQVVRFIAIGDAGEGNADQFANASTVKDVCDAKGCDFILYLGDNFYDDGVSSVDDDQFRTKFEEPYADLDYRFYVVLGNHDYGEWSIWEYKTEYEIDYTAHSDKWYLPDKWYSFSKEHVDFFALDTTNIMIDVLESGADQKAWLETQLAASTGTWRIAYGHHPYISNGQHGNAGSYEGYDWLPIANGANNKAFFDDAVCGNVDLYLCGHDHNRQWLEPRCGTEFIVSGAGAKTTDLPGRGNATYFEDDTIEGFVWIEISDNTLTGEIYNINGDLDYTQTLTK